MDSDVSKRRYYVIVLVGMAGLSAAKNLLAVLKV